MVITTPVPALSSSLPRPLSISKLDLPSLSAPSSSSTYLEASAQPISRWAGLLKSSSSSESTTLSSFTPACVNGATVAPREVVVEGISKWKEHLVGSFLGKKVPYFLVLKELEKVLQCKDVVELSSNGDVFYIHCKNPGHQKILIEGEPAFVAGRILVIREWSSELEGKINPFSTIPLWINLEIPRELWTKVGISFAASLFGTPLRMDEYTARMNHTKFARVCVEVASDFKYPSIVSVDLGTRLGAVKATYRWKPSNCTKCHCFGHEASKCSVEMVWVEKEPTEITKVSDPANQGKTQCSPIERTTTPSVVEAPSSNRFFVLNHLDADEDVCHPEEIFQHPKAPVTDGAKLQCVAVVDKRCASPEQARTNEPVVDTVNSPLAEGTTLKGDACSRNESEQLSGIEKTQIERDGQILLTVAKAQEGGDEPKEQRTDEEGNKIMNVSDHGEREDAVVDLELTVSPEGIKEITPNQKHQCNTQVYFPPVFEGGKPPTESLTCLGEPSSNHTKVIPTSQMRVNQEALVLSARLDLLTAQQNLKTQEDLLSPKPPKPKTIRKQNVNPRKGIAMSSSGTMIKQKLHIDL